MTILERAERLVNIYENLVAVARRLPQYIPERERKELERRRDELLADLVRLTDELSKSTLSE